MTPPAGGAFAHALDPVHIGNPDPAARLFGAVVSDGNVRYLVVAPPGTRSFAFPPLPTGAEAAVLFDGGLGRRVQLCVLEGTGIDNLCTRSSAVENPADP